MRDFKLKGSLDFVAGLFLVKGGTCAVSQPRNRVAVVQFVGEHRDWGRNAGLGDGGSRRQVSDLLLTYTQVDMTYPEGQLSGRMRDDTAR